MGNVRIRITAAFALAVGALLLVSGLWTVQAWADEDGYTIPVYRVYNSHTGEHHYTADDYERSVLVGQYGWTDEGLAWTSPSAEVGDPVYRVYNPATGEHHYTKDAYEYWVLVNRQGWNDEGVSWYSANPVTGVAVMRGNKPSNYPYAHHYTLDAYEFSTMTGQWGWTDEGVAWYGLDTTRDLHHAVVTVAGYDPFTIELDATSAPLSVANFTQLVNEGYYDGLTFYRFQDAFCMQGGNARFATDGRARRDVDPIVGEFASNGIANALSHDYIAGTVAMARTTDADSATSEFFVTLADEYVNALNDNYAAFGIIGAPGMAVVDQIVEDHLPYIDDYMGFITSDVSHQAVIESIRMAD